MYKFGGYGIDIQLVNMRNTPDIFWINGNSYVRVAIPEGSTDYDKCYRAHRNAAGEEYYIISVNGIGEIRWQVNSDYDLQRPENKQVAAYFYSITSGRQA